MSKVIPLQDNMNLDEEKVYIHSMPGWPAIPNTMKLSGI